MPWTFIQKTGELIDASGEVWADGYSGAPGAVNDPEKQNIRNVGPIPCGWYSMEAPVDTPDHGPYVIWLKPDPENQMFGRENFGMHGDQLEHPGMELASHGCIVAPIIARRRAWTSSDRRLQVVPGE